MEMEFELASARDEVNIFNAQSSEKRSKLADWDDFVGGNYYL